MKKIIHALGILAMLCPVGAAAEDLITLKFTEQGKKKLADLTGSFSREEIDGLAVEIAHIMEE